MNAQTDMADTTSNLEGMDLDGLRALRKKIDRVISSYEGRQRQTAVAAAEEVAKEHGFKLTDLVGGRQSGKPRKTGETGTQSPAAYANPDNPDQTWTGRGRRPGWFVDALAAGKTQEDLTA